MKLRDSLAQNRSIRLQAEANTWQEAVKIGVDLLVAADVVEPRYYQAILDGVDQFGPYFVIAPAWRCRMAVRKKGSRKPVLLW
nr:sugar phosphotransferase [Salmonella sp. NCTC 7297]